LLIDHDNIAFPEGAAQVPKERSRDRVGKPVGVAKIDPILLASIPVGLSIDVRGPVPLLKKQPVDIHSPIRQFSAEERAKRVIPENADGGKRFDADGIEIDNDIPRSPQAVPLLTDGPCPEAGFERILLVSRVEEPVRIQAEVPDNGNAG
jgi:hypothetical protein